MKYTNLYIFFNKYLEMEKVLKMDTVSLSSNMGEYKGYLKGGARSGWG